MSSGNSKHALNLKSAAIPLSSKMFRATVRSLNLSTRICNPHNFSISPCELNVQSVRRWRYRRPLELGSSKSKLFFVPEDKPRDVEEHNEMKRLYKIYRYVLSLLS